MAWVKSFPQVEARTGREVVSQNHAELACDFGQKTTNPAASNRHRVHQNVHLQNNEIRKSFFIIAIQNRLEARRSAIHIKGPGENLGLFRFPPPPMRSERPRVQWGSALCGLHAIAGTGTDIGKATLFFPAAGR
jgi:hypothetical protein